MVLDFAYRLTGIVDDCRAEQAPNGVGGIRSAHARQRALLTDGRRVVEVRSRFELGLRFVEHQSLAVSGNPQMLQRRRVPLVADVEDSADRQHDHRVLLAARCREQVLDFPEVRAAGVDHAPAHKLADARVLVHEPLGERRVVRSLQARVMIARLLSPGNRRCHGTRDHEDRLHESRSRLARPRAGGRANLPHELGQLLQARLELREIAETEL